jgi:general secretion pathway protein D
LENIVKSTRPGGTEQSRSAATAGGTERFFEEVVIKADAPRTVTGDQPGGAMLGSNNLVIAARSDDWERIKKLIEELDTPQPQVIIEVLIADLTLVEQRALGVSMRNPLGFGLANGVNGQSAQIEPFLVDSVSNPTTIAGDLLRRGYDAATGGVSANCDPGGTGGNACISAARLLPQGTAVLSLNDVGTGQTWAIGQIRNAISNKKVLLHPHLITTNNKKAELMLKTEKLLVDEGSGSTGGTTTQTRKWIPATISVNITPRISAGGMVNLNVAIEINQFTNSNTDPNNADSGNKNTRNVITNANVRSGNVLALGGLTRADSSSSQNQTPWLGNIPIIGWFFKNRNSEIDKNNLTVFISPIIIEPRLRGGVGDYTKEYVQLAKSYSNEGGLFDNLRDPITRWFFKPLEVSVETPVDEFVSQDELMAPTLFDTRVEQKKALVQATPAPIPHVGKQPELKDLVAGLDTNPFAKA